MTKSSNSGGEIATFWLVALGAGVLASALVLVLTDWMLIQAIFIGLLVFLGVGLLLTLLMRGATMPPVASNGVVTGTAAAGAAAAGAAVAASATKSDAAAKAAAAKAAAAEKEAAAAAKAAADKKAAAEAAKPAATKKTAAKKPAAKKAAPKKKAAAEDYDGDGFVEGANEGKKPKTLKAARGGKADDLKQIKGVGPKMEKLCNSMGFYHFDQIAAWNAEEVAWVNANLEGFKGRVTRDNWVEQAKVLAAGGGTEFSKRVEGGGVY